VVGGYRPPKLGHFAARLGGHASRVLTHVPTSALPANVHLRCVSSNYYEDRSIARPAEFGVSTRSSQAGAVSLWRRRVSILRLHLGRRPVLRASQTDAGGSTALITTSRLSCRKRQGTTAPCHSASVRHGRHRSRRKRRSDTSAGSSVASSPRPCGQGLPLHGEGSIRSHEGDRPRQHGEARQPPERQARPCVAKSSPMD
jgi:hypothetical protein